MNENITSCILITGGYGFIASNFINFIVPKYPRCLFINLDRLDKVASRKNVEANIHHAKNYVEVIGDCASVDLIKFLLKTYNVERIIHFAAQTHVDNSFGNSFNFTQDNVYATHVLLECARNHPIIKSFIHVSTDEVYGEIGLNDPPSDPTFSFLNPTNPYAATKTAAEYLVKSYFTSYGLPTIITRCNNVYGPRQYPEKIIPRFILQSLTGMNLTIQGNGSARRRFVHADDVARAYEVILTNGIPGSIYQIGTSDEYSVMEIAQIIHSKMRPHIPFETTVTWVQDRPFNDSRYAVNTSLLESLGWKQQIDFESGLLATIDWYSKIQSDHWSEKVDLTPPSLIGNLDKK